VINRGVDVKYFEKPILDSQIENIINKYQIDTSKNIILYPARLTKWKGQIEFLDIFNKMQNDNFLLYFYLQKYSKKVLKNIYELI